MFDAAPPPVFPKDGDEREEDFCAEPDVPAFADAADDVDAAGFALPAAEVGDILSFACGPFAFVSVDLASPACEEGVEEDAAAFSLFFSAFRSMVTGRFELAEEGVELDGAVPEGPEVPEASDEPAPLPPEEDEPPGDFLSVAIVTPPEPARFQDLHYTRLVGQRYRPGKSICAATRRLPGSG